nr:serine hydrolase domain-containing protein [Geomicrobium sp. JCM 19038]
MASSPQERRKWNELEAYIQSQMQAYAIPGASIAVSKDNQLVYSKGFGYRDIEQKLPVTKDTIFGVASITKSFTALAIMHMHDQKQLSIEDQLLSTCPNFPCVEEVPIKLQFPICYRIRQVSRHCDVVFN